MQQRAGRCVVYASMQSVQNQVCAGMLLRVCEGCLGVVVLTQQQKRAGQLTRSLGGGARSIGLVFHKHDRLRHDIIGFHIE